MLPRSRRFILVFLLAVLLALALLVLWRAAFYHPAPTAYFSSPATRPFDPDQEPDSLDYADLERRLGPVPKPTRRYRIGAVMKFFGNPYWQNLAQGMQSRAEELGVQLDCRAAASEADPQGQLYILRSLLQQPPDVLLLSPQTDTNLSAAAYDARADGVLIINVNDAVLPEAHYWIGPNNRENGVRAARYLLQRYPHGGTVAVIKGLPGVYAVAQRTAGFIDTLAGSPLTLVAAEHADWNLQRALEVAAGMLASNPDLCGFYCNNDIMALGVVEAVKNAGRLSQTVIIGTDGIETAYDSIAAGELAATVDSFPYLTGRIALEVAVRALERQPLPRAIYSPQNLITRDNLHDPLHGRQVKKRP